MAASIRPAQRSSSPPQCRCFMGDERSPPTPRRAGPRHRPPRPRGGRPGGDPGHQRHRPQRHDGDPQPAGWRQRDRLSRREDDPLVRRTGTSSRAARASSRSPSSRQFADKAHARGLRVLLTLTGDRVNIDLAGAVRRRRRPTSRPSSGATASTTRSGTRQDDTTFWANGPQPAAYAALLKAAYPAIKAADPDGDGARRRPRRQRLRVRRGSSTTNGAKGSFDGVGVHTDTACLTTDPREYYREPNGRIGRYSFTGYREVRATMLAHGDDKPVWMTELGWATTVGDLRARRPRRHQGRRRQPGRAGRLPDQGLRLHGQRPVRRAAPPGSTSHDIKTGDTNDAHNLGLMTDAFVRKPAFAAFQNAGSRRRRSRAAARSTRAPRRSRSTRRPTAQLYLTSLPIHVTATDDEGVNDIDLFVDGKEVPLKTVKSGKGASVKFEWGGAKNLSYGPHTVVAYRARRGQERGQGGRQGPPRRRRQVPVQGPDGLHAEGRQGPRRQGHGPRQDRLEERLISRLRARPRLRLLRALRHQGQALEEGQPLQPRRQARVHGALHVQEARRVARHRPLQAEDGLQGRAREGLEEVQGPLDASKGQAPRVSAASRRSRRRAARPRSACGRRARPCASSASCLAAAVPAVPETIAPAWPIVLPGGAVKPAM